jgi:hypothetical protein
LSFAVSTTSLPLVRKGLARGLSDTGPQIGIIKNRYGSKDGKMFFTQLKVFAALDEIKQELKLLNDVTWVPHVNQQNYAGGWDILPLRCQRQHLQAHPILQGFSIEQGDDWEYLPVMARLPSIRQFLDCLACPIQAVRLMRLHAGAKIQPHSDRGLALKYGCARLHLPIETNAQLQFWVAGQLVPMREGQLWYINADEIHSVTNGGDLPRVNLVIDCEANPWLLQQCDNYSLT